MILESTILGKASQVLGQLNKTDTMAKLTMVNGGIDLKSKVVIAEDEYFTSILHHLGCKGSFGSLDTMCSRQAAHLLRSRGWGDASITGVTVACPFETFRVAEGASCDDHSNKEIGYVLMKGLMMPRDQSWKNGTSIGQISPYLGSGTSLKVQSYGRVISRNSSPILSSAAKLQTLIGWATGTDSNLTKCLEAIVKSITDLTPEIFRPAATEMSGSAEHRLDAKIVKRGGTLSILYTYLTYLHISTNTLVAYGKGSANVCLHFQALMSLISAYWSISCAQEIRSGDLNKPYKISRIYHVHQVCQNC